MNCKHEKIRCTDNRFFCLICGAEIESPYKAADNTTDKNKATEGQKRPLKRKTKKEDD